MSAISKIDSNLSIYRQNTVILWGAGIFGNKLHEMLKEFQIVVEAFCDNDSEKWGTLHFGIPVISPDELNQRPDKQNIVVQISTSRDSNELQNTLEEMGFSSIISYSECFQVVSFYLKLNLIKKDKLFFLGGTELRPEHIFLEQGKIQNAYGEQIICICSPPKTGTTGMNMNLHKNTGSLVHYKHQASELPLDMLKATGKPLKFIVGLREPIAREISNVFEDIGCMGSFSRDWDWDFSQMDGFGMETGGDAQVFFDVRQANYEKRYPTKKDEQGNVLVKSRIAHFFDDFNQQVLNSFDYPFSVEKGWSVIKQGNVEVFIYQLEKLNEIRENLSRFLGIPLEHWNLYNDAGSKWVADAYRTGKKEIRFSQEYVDTIYNEPWVKHFYSPEDIETFKERWKGNIAT